MKRASLLLGWAIYALCCTIIPARGQPAPGVTKAKEWIDQDVQRHRWEINVNAGNLFKLGTSGTYQYNYLIKRNSPERNNGRGTAWRFALSPGFNKRWQYFPGDTSVLGAESINNYAINPMFVLGREWQRIRGRTTLVGGMDLAGLLFFSKGTGPYAQSPWDDSVRGTSVIRYKKEMYWLCPFIGARISLNHRLSISIESQFRFTYGVEATRSEFDKIFVSRSLLEWIDIEPLPNYFIGFSYNL